MCDQGPSSQCRTTSVFSQESAILAIFRCNFLLQETANFQFISHISSPLLLRAALFVFTETISLTDNIEALLRLLSVDELLTTVKTTQAYPISEIMKSLWNVIESIIARLVLFTDSNIDCSVLASPQEVDQCTQVTIPEEVGRREGVS